MSTRRRILLCAGMMLGIGFLGVVSSSTADGEEEPGEPRQHYSDWKEHSEYKYFYRTYHYKPNTASDDYKLHYVVLHPESPDYLYFYNPYKRKYWGRIAAHHDDRPGYSLLPESLRRGRIAEIPESAFPPLGPLPPVPESEDGATLVLPPKDLPSGY